MMRQDGGCGLSFGITSTHDPQGAAGKEAVGITNEFANIEPFLLHDSGKSPKMKATYSGKHQVWTSAGIFQLCSVLSWSLFHQKQQHNTGQQKEKSNTEQHSEAPGPAGMQVP